MLVAMEISGKVDTNVFITFEVPEEFGVEMRFIVIMHVCVLISCSF